MAKQAAWANLHGFLCVGGKASLAMLKSRKPSPRADIAEAIAHGRQRRRGLQVRFRPVCRYVSDFRGNRAEPPRNGRGRFDSSPEMCRVQMGQPVAGHMPEIRDATHYSVRGPGLRRETQGRHYKLPGQGQAIV